MARKIAAACPDIVRFWRTRGAHTLADFATVTQRNDTDQPDGHRAVTRHALSTESKETEALTCEYFIDHPKNLALLRKKLTYEQLHRNWPHLPHFMDRYLRRVTGDPLPLSRQAEEQFKNLIAVLGEIDWGQEILTDNYLVSATKLAENSVTIMGLKWELFVTRPVAVVNPHFPTNLSDLGQRLGADWDEARAAATRVLSTRIDSPDIRLSARTANALRASGMITLIDLYMEIGSEDELLRIRNIGPSASNEVRAMLRGLRLPPLLA